MNGGGPCLITRWASVSKTAADAKIQKMPPKKGQKKGKDKDDAAQPATDKPKTPEPTEKELLLQKEYVLV